MLRCTCDADDRWILATESEARHLIHENIPASTIEAAQQLAWDWVGATAEEREFHELPGVYQAAYYQAITGRRPIGGIARYWAIRADANTFLVREFPQPSEPTSITSDPSQVTFVAMPQDAVAGLLRMDDR